MNIKYIILTIILFLINNIAICYQLNGQLVWDFWKSWKGIATSLLMGIPITALSQWIRDDYDKFTDYTMYTLLPFGRIVRDIAHPEKGLINNPLMIMEKTTGLPLLKVSQLASKDK